MKILDGTRRTTCVHASPWSSHVLYLPCRHESLYVIGTSYGAVKHSSTGKNSGKTFTPIIHGWSFFELSIVMSLHHLSSTFTFHLCADLPAHATWLNSSPSYHQNLSILIDKRSNLKTFGPWQVKCCPYRDSSWVRKRSSTPPTLSWSSEIAHSWLHVCTKGRPLHACHVVVGAQMHQARNTRIKSKSAFACMHARHVARLMTEYTGYLAR